VTVPAIVDIPAGAVVTADYRNITLDLEHQWTAHHRTGAPDLYPDRLRDEIEEISAGVYEDLNNGVYKCGFARTQEAYDEAYGKLFARLDALSERLAGRRYLVGDTITEADVRLWPTLVRFDAVYHGHFKCNRVHTSINPSRIVPDGPDESGWLTPHHREELGGRPFGDGTPPGPPPPVERVAGGPGR